MTKNNTTKKALGSSIFALFMCVMMLIGTTFAWFTDTASTAVNKIQAGTLDVVLEMQDADGNWSDAAGKTLTWKTNDNRNQDRILWEPGCTYELQPVRVKNNGNLDLKYKIVISGINGSAKLNEAIEWTISDTALDSDHSLLAGNTSNELTIKGHMKETAGNEYQNLSIDGIAITVYATQLNSEYDSYGKDYDETATYDLKINESMTETLSVNQTEGQAPIVASQTTVSSGAVSVTYPEGVVLKSDTTVSGETKKTAEVTQKLEYVGTEASAETKQTVAIGDGQAVASYRLELPVAETNTTLIPIKINYEKKLSGLEVYHSGKKIATSAAAAGDDAREYFTYVSSTGELTLYLFHASPIDIIYDEPGAVTVTSLDEFNKALKDEAVTTINVKDINVDKSVYNASIITAPAGKVINILSGTFSNSGSKGVIFFANGGTINISDCYVSYANSWLFNVANGGKIVITGGDFEGCWDTVIVRDDEEKGTGTVIVKGGIFDRNDVKNYLAEGYTTKVGESKHKFTKGEDGQWNVPAKVLEVVPKTSN